MLLNKGSIHSSMTLNDDCSGSVGLREDFAKQCFETLLEFSLLDSGLEAAVRTPGKFHIRSLSNIKARSFHMSQEHIRS